MTFARILYALTFTTLSITYSTSFAFAIPVESWSIAKWPAVDPQPPLHIALESRSDLERDSSLSGEAASHLMRRARGQNEQHTGQYGTSGYHPQPQANLRGPDHAAVTRRPPQPPSSWGSHATGQQFPDPLANQQAPYGGSTHGYGYSTTGQVPHQSTSNGRSSQPVYASLPGTGWTYVGEAYPATGGKQPTHQPQTYGATPHTNQQTQYSYANAQNAQNNHGYVQPGYSRPVTSQYGQPQSGYPQPGYSSQQVATKPSRSRPVIPIPELPQQPASDSSYSGPVIPDMAEVLRDKKEAKSKGVLKKFRKS